MTGQRKGGGGVEGAAAVASGEEGGEYGGDGVVGAGSTAGGP